MNGTPITTHPLSFGGSLGLIVAFELVCLLSFFVSAWAWGRMIRGEPEGTLGNAAFNFGIGFGALTLAPAGVFTWYICGAQTAGITLSEIVSYALLTICGPMLVYFLPFRFRNTPVIRIIAHLVFTSIICEAFCILVSHNGPESAAAGQLYTLQWVGLLMVFNSWETHGWAYVERVPAANGLLAWAKSFTIDHRPQFLRMFVLWHFYLVGGEVVLLNFALAYVPTAEQVAPIFKLYAKWVENNGAIESAAYALAAMGALMLAVFVETMSQTRTTRDVALTEQGELEKNLRITNARYAAVLNNAPYAVFQFNRNLTIDVENTQATLLLGAISPYRNPEEGSLPLPDAFLQTCRAALAGQRTFIEGELPIARGDETRWYRLICEPVLDENEQCVAAVAVLDDQTERKQRETELKQLTADAEFARAAAQNANTAKSRFLANMSHEIRTPMNGIYSSIQLLGDPRLQEEKRGRVLDIMRRSADSMIKLLNDILDLSKVEAGAMKIKLAPVHLPQLGANVISLFQAAADHKQLALQLQCDLPDGFEHVQADELRLQQMLSNLTGNAIKFTMIGSVTLQIAAVAREDNIARIRFSVIDTGAGISQDELRTIFNAYHQLENQLSGTSDGNAPKGTGLGLTIVKHLAELMRGTVGVESKTGAGSSFWFEVPLQRVESK